jgi:hypothetical protein
MVMSMCSAQMCSTCVFRSGNLMDLRSGRVRGMIEEAISNDSTIVCHQTLDGDSAACYGFFERYPTIPLRLAVILKMIVWEQPHG